MSDDTLAAAEVAAGRELAFLRASAAGWTLRTKIEAGLAVLALLACVAAWAFWPARPVPEKVVAHDQVRQADGSLIAATVPAGSASAAALGTPKAKMPAGAKVERQQHFTAQATPTATDACPPVSVDLLQVRNPDGSRSVIASSRDGQVLTATDVPIDPAPLPPPEKPWAAGLAYGTDHAVGVWLERDLGRLRAGIEVDRGPGGARAQVRLGVRW